MYLEGFGGGANLLFSKPESEFNHRVYDASGLSPSITKGHNNTPKVIVHDAHPRNGDPARGGTGPLSKEDEAYALNACSKQLLEVTVHNLEPRPIISKSGEAYCLDSDQQQVVERGSEVRCLTPRECERLMSWPDDWTRYGLDSKGKQYELSDSARYRLCGNGVVSSVVSWIASRIEEAIR